MRAAEQNFNPHHRLDRHATLDTGKEPGCGEGIARGSLEGAGAVGRLRRHGLDAALFIEIKPQHHAAGRHESQRREVGLDVRKNLRPAIELVGVEVTRRTGNARRRRCRRHGSHRRRLGRLGQQHYAQQARTRMRR